MNKYNEYQRQEVYDAARKNIRRSKYGFHMMWSMFQLQDWQGYQLWRRRASRELVQGISGVRELWQIDMRLMDAKFNLRADFYVQIDDDMLKVHEVIDQQQGWFSKHTSATIHKQVSATWNAYNRVSTQLDKLVTAHAYDARVTEA